MPRLTKDTRIAELEEQQKFQYSLGLRAGMEAQKLSMQGEFASAKLQQLQAAAKLMEEMGRMASRIGYMVGKINGENGR